MELREKGRLISYLSLFILIILLNACTGVRRDGPPSFYVDASNIPDAIPKAESLSKFGNNPTYQVYGKKYRVMRSSKNYEERGIASWYGTLFHKRRTSSGERYDMLAMTAAHKTLPLPTYVQVTNLANGKQVIVKVNDRGPFESNRLIDLSYIAAKKLGILGRGTALVDVKAIDPVHYERNSMLAQNSVPSYYQTKSHTAKPSIYLQVGIFRNKLYAEKLKKRLLPLVSSPVQIIHLAHTKKLYRVSIGPIKDVITASRITQRLKMLGLHSKKSVA